MKITQGTFSFLPDLSDDEIRAQMEYALQQGWSLSVEYTDDPHPRNCYWEMFGTPMFDLHDAAGAMLELQECRKTSPITTSRSTLLIRRGALNRFACPSSSTARAMSPALA